MWNDSLCFINFHSWLLLRLVNSLYFVGDTYFLLWKLFITFAHFYFLPFRREVIGGMGILICREYFYIMVLISCWLCGLHINSFSFWAKLIDLQVTHDASWANTVLSLDYERNLEHREVKPGIVCDEALKEWSFEVPSPVMSWFLHFQCQLLGRKTSYIWWSSFWSDMTYWLPICVACILWEP